MFITAKDKRIFGKERRVRKPELYLSNIIKRKVSFFTSSLVCIFSIISRLEFQFNSIQLNDDFILRRSKNVTSTHDVQKYTSHALTSCLTDWLTESVFFSLSSMMSKYIPFKYNGKILNSIGRIHQKKKKSRPFHAISHETQKAPEFQ